MEGQDCGDDRTFNVNFSADGAAKLRETVNDKLQEFMGDYTDDTLVEYVIVLLRNGRQKEEAKNELNVFLGSDSDFFVNWLWDHLSLNLHLYVQPQESYPDEIPEAEPLLGDKTGIDDSQLLDFDSEREKSTRESKSRRNREWKGLVRDAAEPPPLRSSVIESFHVEDKNHNKSSRVKQTHSPVPPVQKKRNRQDDRQESKREVPSRPKIGAPRRLLQFAVRDAVGTLRSSSSKMEPTLKRLRSVVSTSTGDSLSENQPQRIRSVARVPSAMATALKAAAAAAEDVTKLRCSANVFDRLGHGMDVSEMTNQSLGFKRTMVADAEPEDFDQMQRKIHPDYIQRSEGSAENMIMDRHTNVAYDSTSDNEYDGINVLGDPAMDASRSRTSFVNKEEDSLSVQYSVAKNTGDVMRRTRVKDQDPSSAVPNTSRKIVNISVNVNTWKPPHYQVSRDVSDVENLKAIPESKVATGNLGVQLMKENNNTTMAVKENERHGSDMPKESQTITPGSYSTVRPSEDADSRTIFVNNVHFAATKDTLSRHFNKFGEVLKVVIVTDAATGLPKGSAYIEFVRKEAVEHALSLNGTSFMSRILKVVKKSSASQEVAPVMTWPRVARASPFAARLTRAPFPRAQTAFRTRLPIKAGARSLQWKRDSPSHPAVEGSMNAAQNVAPLSTNNVPSPTASARSLTYVRTEAKPVGNSGPA